MKSALYVLMCGCLMGVASAAIVTTVTATDGDGNAFGDTQGFRIDFDATHATLADWVPDLVSGWTYSLDSLSVRSSNTNATPVYLGVYTNISGGVCSGFQGVSDNAVNFSSVASGAWAEFTFTGINVTVDSVAGSGSGNLFFLFQTGTAARTGTETTRSIHRFNAETGNLTSTLANIISWGGINNTRAPEYQAQLTVPEPATMVLLGLGSLLFSRKR